MFILRHPNTTTDHGAPSNWNAETDGPCETLPTISVNLDGRIVHASFWQPEPEELELLNRGASIELHILQPVHPVVSVRVNAWPGAVAPVADDTPTPQTHVRGGNDGE